MVVAMPSRTLKVFNYDNMAHLQAYIKSRRSQVVLMGEKLDILLLQGKLRHAHLLRGERERGRGGVPGQKNR